MREGIIDYRVWRRRDGGIVTAVLVIMGDWANSKSDGLNYLEGEELEEFVSRVREKRRKDNTKETQKRRGMRAQRMK